MSSTFNWVDGVLLAVMAVSAILAFFRGLVREVLGIGAWAGALLAAFYEYTHKQLTTEIAPHVDPPWLAEALGAGAVFLVALIILMVIIHWIANQVQGSMLGGVDRTLGIAFGLARGAIAVVVTYIMMVVYVMPIPERWPEAVRQSRSLPVVADSAAWLVARLPEEFRPRLPDQPGRPAPSQEDLSRPPPSNRN